MTTILKELREDYDIVLIDAPPLLPVTDAALLASQADGAILVVRHGKTTADQVRAAADRLTSVGAEPAGVIFNMTPAKGSGEYGYGYGYGYEPENVTHSNACTRTPEQAVRPRNAPRHLINSVLIPWVIRDMVYA